MDTAMTTAAKMTTTNESEFISQRPRRPPGECWMRTFAAAGTAGAAARRVLGLRTLVFRYFIPTSAFPHIAVAAHGHDIARRCRVIFNLDAQAANVDVNDFEFSNIVVPPDHFQDIVARKRAPSIGHKGF